MLGALGDALHLVVTHVDRSIGWQGIWLVSLPPTRQFHGASELASSAGNIHSRRFVCHQHHDYFVRACVSRPCAYPGFVSRPVPAVVNFRFSPRTVAPCYNQRRQSAASNSPRKTKSRLIAHAALSGTSDADHHNPVSHEVCDSCWFMTWIVCRLPSDEDELDMSSARNLQQLGFPGTHHHRLQS